MDRRCEKNRTAGSPDEDRQNGRCTAPKGGGQRKSTTAVEQDQAQFLGAPPSTSPPFMSALGLPRATGVHPASETFGVAQTGGLRRMQGGAWGQ